MKYSLVILLAMCPAVAFAWPSPAAPAVQTPHPAVARVIAAERNGASLGTGVLVATDETHGLVVTNWHVVRDATGPITVVFPDGFRSGALLLKTDRDWDLAALAIQRPRATPLPLAAEPPRPGEPLSIAGYGPQGVYRAIGGRCVQYHSPGGSLPREIVEVDVEARRGDSGGPIWNSRGEVAGILFGAAGDMWSGYTMGSYCGRVRVFLAAAYVDFERLPGNTAMVAQAPAPQPAPQGIPNSVPQLPSPSGQSPNLANSPPQILAGASGSPGAERGASSQSLARTGPFGAPLPSGGTVSKLPAVLPPVSSSPVAQVSPATVASRIEPPANRTDQIKTVFAAIGVIAILFHGLRLVGASVG